MQTGDDRIITARSLDDIRKLPKHLLFNDARSYRSSDLLILNPNLTPEEKEDALFWRQLLNNFNGLMLVTGEPGSGKGIFMHMLSKKINYYYNKLIITDTRPTEIFGFNIPFSFPMLIEQLDRMQELDTGIPRPFVIKGLSKSDFDGEDSYNDYRELSDEDKYKVLVSRGIVKQATLGEEVTFKEYDSRTNRFMAIPKIIPHVEEDGTWISSRGEVFLRNSVIVLDEFGSKYMPKSTPNLGESQVLLNMFNFWRHLQCFMMGVGVTLDDFNPRSFDKCLWEARCISVDSTKYKGTSDGKLHWDIGDIIVEVNIYPTKFNPLTGSLQSNIRNRQQVYVNGSMPRTWLNGYAVKDSYITDNAQSMHIPGKFRSRRME